MRFKGIFLLIFILFSKGVFSQKKIIFEVQIQGTKKTNTNFLKNVLVSQKGNRLDSVSIEKDITLLKRMPAISNATYQTLYSHKNYYTIFIYIEEHFTTVPDVNIWTTINQQFSYKLGVYEYNFLGRNMVLGGFYQFNGFNTYAINFKAPYLFSKKWGLALNHQNWKSEEPLYFRDKTANYLYNNISFEVLGLYQLNLKNKIDFGINIFQENYQYLSGDTDPSIPLIPISLDKIVYKLVYKYDDLKYHYQYVSGFKSVLFAQYVSTENYFQNPFFIAWNDFFYYKTIGENGNWANRMRFGLSSNKNTPFAPFALDNNINLRGVGILVDRGTGSFVLNTEYKHTI